MNSNEVEERLKEKQTQQRIQDRIKSARIQNNLQFKTNPPLNNNGKLIGTHKSKHRRTKQNIVSINDTSRVICTLNRKKDNYNQSDLFVLTTDPVQPSSLRKSQKSVNKHYRS